MFNDLDEQHEYFTYLASQEELTRDPLPKDFGNCNNCLKENLDEGEDICGDCSGDLFDFFDNA
jgi:hydrogenase maturation factor HypF (carbamoyltransferase family)